MTGRVKVGWHVPTDEWDSFTDYIVDKHGQATGYVGDEVERAVREWADTDDYVTSEAGADDVTRHRPIASQDTVAFGKVG